MTSFTACRHRSLRGFTLPEVLATMMIIAIIVPVAMRGVSVGMQGAAEGRHKLEAAQLAQNKINELLTERQASNLAGAGDFGEAWPEYRWESATSAFSSSSSADLTQVEVTVLWKAQGVDRKVTLSTIVYPLQDAAIVTESAGGQ